MKNKFLFLSIISSCVLSINGWADSGNSTTPPQKRACYPASTCTGDPNLIGGNNGSNGGNAYAGGNNAMNSNGSGMMGSDSTAPKVLQTTSTEQFVGTIKSVNRVSLPNQTQIQVVLTTDQGDMLVILGPASFIDQSKVKLQVGDKVTVTGYRITANGNVVIMAAQVKKNGYTLQLLDDNRKPLWTTQGALGQPASGAQYSGYQYSGLQNPNVPNSRY